VALAPATLVNWWRRRRLSTPRYPAVRRFVSHSELPQGLHPREVALLGSAERPKWLLMQCPCGQGHMLSISLQGSHDPHWDLALDPDGPTLFPSVDSRTEIRCHFVLRRGRVQWVTDRPRYGPV
jgi:hypothetical protein